MQKKVRTQRAVEEEETKDESSDECLVKGTWYLKVKKEYVRAEPVETTTSQGARETIGEVSGTSVEP